MAMNFSKGDVIEWEIIDKDTLILKRKESEDCRAKKILSKESTTVYFEFPNSKGPFSKETGKPGLF